MRRFTIPVAVFLFSVSIGANCVRAQAAILASGVSSLAVLRQQAEGLQLQSPNSPAGSQGGIAVPQPDAFRAGLWGLVGLGVFSKLRGSRVR